LADSSGAAFWAACDTLLVADLHLEKGSAYANRGVFLPPYDTRDTLERLALVVAHYDPRRVIVLGDSFHSTAAAASLDSANLDLLGKLLDPRLEVQDLFAKITIVHMNLLRRHLVLATCDSSEIKA